tara:strand:+ start:664 stop:1074 length:411 start_codon:yes stop_codon:yes gene_type:complete
MTALNLLTLAIGQLCFQNLAHCRKWDASLLLKWAEWFIVKGRYWTVVRDGKLAGVALVRFVDDEAGCRKDYTDTGGKVCFVDATVAKGSGVMKELYTKMFNEMGHRCETMAWVRPKHNNKIVCVPMERARRRLIKG